MPILGILASSTRVAAGDFESIATVTVGAGGSSSVTFSSIAAIYSHLQLRISARTNRSSYADDMQMQFNNDTTNGNYYQGHLLRGEGTGIVVSAYGTSTNISVPRATGNTNTSTFGVSIIDILDYASTNKHKTVRVLGGMENNTNGEATVFSGLWFPSSIAAISSIKFAPASGTQFEQYSHFALYGIKSA